MKKIFMLIMLLALCVGCSANEKNESENDEIKQSEDNIKENEDVVEERAFLVQKYLEIEKGKSFEDVKVIVEKEGIKISDSGEYDAQDGYKKRETRILDGQNELLVTFRDNQVASKTFTYDSENVNSTWFYSNYYDILDADPEAGESHGIWKEAVVSIECIDEYDMMIKLNDEIENK